MEKIEITRPSFNHFKIHTEVTIDAPQPNVWKVLADTTSTNTWSKSIIILDGDVKDGGVLTVSIRPLAKLSIAKKYRHTLFARDGECFGWNDTKVLGAHDNHQFAIHPHGDGKTRFIHSDELIGGMAWLIGGLKMIFLKGIYGRFNHELKAEVERQTSTRTHC